MSFRFYTNLISSTSRSVVAGIFTTGLALIGFGLMIYLMPRFFATLAAVIFFVAGLSCVVTAGRIFYSRKKLNKINSEGLQVYRENVRIHFEEDL